MTTHTDPATVPVALLRDSADRRVAQLGTDCLEEEDCRLLDNVDGNDLTCCYGTMLYIGELASPAFGERGFSPRFIAIAEHFRAQGYDYLWFDRDRETVVASPEDTAPVRKEDVGIGDFR